MPQANDSDFIIKICGVTTYEDAQAAIDLGANAIGFNFYAGSPRFISQQRAVAIIEQLTGQFLRVGVFVHPDAESLKDVASFLDVAQIHGSGGAPVPVWRAIRAGEKACADDEAQAWLLDSFAANYGGSGKTFDWSLAAEFPHRAIVAGGLDGGNVGDAIRIAKPWGVDSCSRLESTPGKKDHARVADFIQGALTAFHAHTVII